jgi:hypothetical protein
VTGAELRIGVVLEAFLDWPLERVLPWLRQAAPEITDIEVGAGGYAPHPHCDVAALLHSATARSARRPPRWNARSTGTCSWTRWYTS